MGTRLGARAGMAVAFAVGCVTAPGFASAGSPDGAQSRDAAAYTRNTKAFDKAVLSAERVVTKQPQSAEARVRLAQTYLGAGRFLSAGTSFEDAVSLGDKSPSTALGMALSYIGSGRNAEAIALLGQWRETIPASDHALALALAGQPAEAISILSAAIKQGENTPKIRQNLAYAFALSGRIAEARVVASQDVPADQLDGRVSDWALQASVGTAQSRVAALLGAPVRTDPGQPQSLALATSAGPPALAAAELAAADQPAAAELPAIAAPEPMLAQVAPQPASAVALASAAPTAVEPTPTGAASAARQFVSNAVVQDTSAYSARALASVEPAAPARTARAPEHPHAAKAATSPTRSQAAASHVVQLGSFASEEGARRAWNIFVQRDPSLKSRELRITKALVNGRNYWRVAAGGFDAGSARAKCSSVGSGRECLAYAARRQLPGAVSAVAQRLASR